LRETYDLIVGTTRVVCPCRLLHDLARDGLKVHQVVALLQNGHARNALLPRFLIRIDLLRFFLDGIHVHLAQVLGLVEILVERVGRVDWLKCLGAVLASILQDNFLTSGMLRQKLGDIVGAAVDDDPA